MPGEALREGGGGKGGERGKERVMLGGKGGVSVLVSRYARILMAGNLNLTELLQNEFKLEEQLQ